MIRLLLASLLLSGCAVIEWAGVGVLGRRADLPEASVKRGISYAGGAGRTLDLYLPAEKGAPVLVFVHGGGWNSGDKDLRVGGLDVYGNIGRFYASQGILTAVIDYRLMPEVTWRGQAEDVARAVAWAHANAAAHGGDPERLFVMGHSAGGHLAAHVALNQGLQRSVGLGEGAIDGLIVASGAALDLLDDTTYLTEDVRYYEKRFGPRDPVAWAAASPITHVDERDVPVLVLYATGESKGLRRQATHFAERLKAVQVETQVIPVPGQSHERMVLVLSHPERVAVPEILHFVMAGPE